MPKYLKVTLKYLPVAVVISLLVATVIDLIWAPLLSFVVLFVVALAIYKSFSVGTMPNPKQNPPDDDASLEDDIRHHDYGYPGFYEDDDERG